MAAGSLPSSSLSRQTSETTTKPTTRVLRRAAIYARQRGNSSEIESSLNELCAAAAKRRWQVCFEYADVASNELRQLPVLDALVEDARTGCFQVFLIRRLSDLAQSPAELERLLPRLERWGVTFVSHQDGIDTSASGSQSLIEAVLAAERLGRVHADLFRRRIVRAIETDRGRDLDLSELGGVRAARSDR